MPLINALATWLQHFDDELRLRQNHRKNQEVRPLAVSLYSVPLFSKLHAHAAFDFLGVRQHSCDSNF
jgi:hypothetical protein